LRHQISQWRLSICARTSHVSSSRKRGMIQRLASCLRGLFGLEGGSGASGFFDHSPSPVLCPGAAPQIPRTKQPPGINVNGTKAGRRHWIVNSFSLLRLTDCCAIDNSYVGIAGGFRLLTRKSSLFHSRRTSGSTRSLYLTPDICSSPRVLRI
jgi:hypothetical protein